MASQPDRPTLSTDRAGSYAAVVAPSDLEELVTSAGEYPQAGTAAGASRVLHLPASGRWALLGLDGPAGFQFEFDLMDGPVADTLAAPPTEHPALVRRPA